MACPPFARRPIGARLGGPQRHAPGLEVGLAAQAGDGRPRTIRTPPAPYRETSFRLGPGYCCVCGQAVFRFGWHRDLWNDGRPNQRAIWHAGCVAAWKWWNAPSQHGKLLSKLQKRRCTSTGTRLLRTAEVDHRIPLFQVWRDHKTLPWPDLLAFWGAPNLQVINRPAHVAKSAAEAGDRASGKAGGPPLAPKLFG